PGLRARDPEADEGRPGIAGRWGSLVTRHPVVVLAVLGLALLAMAVPAAGLRLGLPDEGTMSEDTTQRRAYDLIAAGLGPGAPAEAGDTAIVAVGPATGPGAVGAEGLVTDSRERADALERETGAAVAVAGTPAVVIDFSDKRAQALLPYLGLVAGLSF